MRFQVPQFIEVENKIFGPFTFKQFIYLAGGAGMCFVIYTILPFFLAIMLIVPIGVLTLALAFYRINNRPFIDILESSFKYMTGSKLYIWKKEPKHIQPNPKKETALSDTSGLFVPRLSESKLKDIAWSLDVQNSIYAGQEKKKGRE